MSGGHSRVRSALGAALLAGTSVIAAGAAHAQSDAAPAMRDAVYTRLAEAQRCAEMEDFECANRVLGEVRGMTDLNAYETAQMWSFYAFLYFEQDNFREAIAAYENVLEQPNLPPGLEAATSYSLAKLFVEQEMYREGLERLDRWSEIGTTPSPDVYILKAQIHYRLEQYEEGLEAVLTALEIARTQNHAPQESWYQLRNVLYFELGDFSGVIETLTTLLERWPKRDYLIQLAGIYGQEGRESSMLALYEAAYEAGWLERGSDYTNFAQMLLAADIPYKAATIMERKLRDGTVESTQANWRILAQAWQRAREDEKALPALERASNLADDGNIDMLRAQSYANLARWDECIEAARTALARGGLDRPDQTNLILGNCFVEKKEYDAARRAFQSAARDERSRNGANQWLRYVEAEENREAELEAALGRG